MWKNSRCFIKERLGEKTFKLRSGKESLRKRSNADDAGVQIFATSKNPIFKSTKLPHQNISE
jgi:hypothetical protein